MPAHVVSGLIWGDPVAFAIRDADSAAKMEKEHFNKEAGTGPLIPADFLLIRADQSTSFREIQKLMEFCGEKGVQIWKVQLAASEPPSEEE